MEPFGTGQRAVLIWITPDRPRLDEMSELCRSAGYDIVEQTGQSRDGPDPHYYVGPGKIDEIGALDVDHIITTGDLTPSQTYCISHRTGKRTADRTRVILDIFRRNAIGPEARMQVEIADLRYQLPILKEYIHQGTLSERPGFMAGGEYAVNYYHDMIRKRMTSLKRKLEEERSRRGHKRALRRRKGAYLVSVAGYTNAGKSSLFNALMMSRSDGKASDVGGQMFTTISTTTRRMKGGRGCLISDTVGFIRDLPPWLVEGFMSTLEEIFEADVVVLVLDASEPLQIVSRKLSDSLEILRKGGTRGHILLALNKMDLIPDPVKESELREGIMDGLSDTERSMVNATVSISARNGTGLDELLERIEELLPPLMKVGLMLPFPGNNEELVASLRKYSYIVDEGYSNGFLTITAMMEDRWAGHFIKRVKEAGGKALPEG
ncbi:MAG: GTPase HflX [Candidatus Thermoplasmatota archaeon]|nr:GTPase HflX [Candidatus Thermoplasmatota archaeon]